MPGSYCCCGDAVQVATSMVTSSSITYKHRNAADTNIGGFPKLLSPSRAKAKGNGRFTTKIQLFNTFSPFTEKEKIEEDIIFSYFTNKKADLKQIITMYTYLKWREKWRVRE